VECLRLRIYVVHSLSHRIVSICLGYVLLILLLLFIIVVAMEVAVYVLVQIAIDAAYYGDMPTFTCKILSKYYL